MPATVTRKEEIAAARHASTAQENNIASATKILNNPSHAQAEWTRIDMNSPPPQKDCDGVPGFMPPIPIWKFFALMALSLTLYEVVWVYRFAQDRRNAGEKVSSPWLYVLGILTPLVSIFVVGKVARATSGLCAEYNVKPTVASGAVIALYVLGYLVVTIADQETITLLLFGLLLLAPAPFLILQRDINRVKELHPEWCYRYPSFRFRPSHYVTFVAGLALLGILAIPIHNELMLYTKDSLPVGSPYASTSGLYTITPQSSGWRIVENGTNGAKSADLEIAMPKAQTFVVFYVHDSGNLNSVVNDRLEVLADTLTVTSRDEVRRYQQDSDIPVSIAHYVGLSNASRSFWWIATLDMGDHVIEALGYSDHGAAAAHKVEQIIRSVRTTGADGAGHE